MNGIEDGALNALNVSTHRHIRRSPNLIDGIFQGDPVAAMIKKSCLQPFPGGRVIAGNFQFDTLVGGGYNSGEDFDLSDKKIDEQYQFFVKYMGVNVTTNLENTEVLNSGEAATYREIDSKLKNAYNFLGSSLGISLYMKSSTTNYGRLITGLAEAVSDGTNNSWDGATYATYGGLTRSSYNGALLSYVATAGGNQLEYDDLTDAIQECSWGEGEQEANVIAGTPKLANSIKKRFQVMQKLTETTPVIGFKGFSIEGTSFMKSRYVPGQDVATSGKKSNRVAVNFLRGTSRGLITSYPSVSGETAFIGNFRKPNIHLHISTAPRYQFGFTGWKVSALNTKLSGQVLWAGQLTVDNPSYFGQITNCG